MVAGRRCQALAPDAVTVASDRLVFKPRLVPVA